MSNVDLLEISIKDNIPTLEFEVILDNPQEESGKFEIQFAVVRRKDDGKIQFALLRNGQLIAGVKSNRDAIDWLQLVLTIKKFKVKLHYKWPTEQVGEGYMITMPADVDQMRNLEHSDLIILEKCLKFLQGVNSS